MSNESVVYKCREVQQLLGIHENTVYRWIASGKLKPVNRGDDKSHYLFLKQDIDAMLANK